MCIRDSVCSRVVSLPLYPELDAAAVDQIIAAVRGFPVAGNSTDNRYEA